MAAGKEATVTGSRSAGAVKWPTPSTPLGETAAQYVTWRLVRGQINAVTASHLIWRIESLVKTFGARPVAELDRQAIDDWSATIGHLAPATRWAYQGAVIRFVTWMVVYGLLDDDPTTGLAKVRKPRKVPATFTRDEVERLLAVCDLDRDRLIVLLMISMGLRRGEVAAVRVEDYDARRRTLVVRGKAANERSLPVPDDVADLIAIVAGHDVAGPLILTASGRWGGMVRVRMRIGAAPMDVRTIGARVTVLMERAGIKRPGHSGHALRRTCATEILDECGDLRVAQALLGHQSVATTDAYLRPASMDQLRTAMAGRRYGNAG